MNNALPSSPGKFLFFFIKRHRWLFAGFMLCAFVVPAGIQTALYFIGEVIDILANYEDDRSRIWENITPLLLTIVGLYFFLDAVPSRIRRILLVNIDRRVRYDVRTMLSNYLIGHNLEYFQNDFSGRLAAKATETANNISRILKASLYDGMDAVFISLTVLVVFFSVHWSFGVVLLIWMFIFTSFMLWTIPKINAMSSDVSEERSLLTGKFVDIISNISSVFSNTAAGREKTLIAGQSKILQKKEFRHDLFLAYADVFKEGMWYLNFSPMLIFMIWHWQQGHITPGQIAMMLPMLLNIARTFWVFSQSMNEISSEYGMMDDAVKTIVVPYGQKDGKGVLNIRNVPDIHIKDIDFRHETELNTEILFRDFNLHIPPGQKTGFVGPSGAGKSTLVNLLLRFHDIQSGHIEIDEQNIMDVELDSLRRNISLIPQDTSLFHRSLMDNVRYGRLNATDEEVIKAAKKAHAHEFISALPQGYETLVGERGVKLSGGQRQRIAIARAILKDAPILILDEATSALDSESEKLIQESLKELMKGKTVIAIAHRLSTIAHLDRLIVMDKGRIVEDGTHEDLLKHGGLYARLWHMQSGGFLGE